MVRCAADLALQAARPAVGHRPARLATASRAREGIFITFHSQLVGKRSSRSQNQCGAVHTAANMPFLPAPRPDLNIYLSSLCYLMRHEQCTGSLCSKLQCPETQ